MKIQRSTSPQYYRSLLWTGLVLIIATAARADYHSTVLADGPLAYYALNPAANGTSVAPDLTGNGNDGVAAGVTAAAGPSQFLTNAAYFNGSADIDLSQGSNPGLLDFSGPITIEAWAQPSSSSLFGDIVAKGYDSSTYQEIVVRVNGPYGANYYGSSGSVGVNGGSQTTNWSYMVLSSDGTNCSLYQNGVLVNHSGDTSGSIVFGDDWVIGNGSSAGNTRFFNGNISEVAIYGQGLTAAQVLNHYFVGLLNSDASVSVPIINTQPQSQSTYAGDTVTFSVAAVSALGMTNQWYKNGSALGGQTNTTLVLHNVSSGDAVGYTVAVGNANGITNSVSATLTLLAPGPALEWSANNNSGAWDTGVSSNWLSLAHDSQTVFSTSDQVLFDDTPGVPTTVSVSGSVAPSVMTVDSSTNAFTIQNGTITGPGSLLKEGMSVLTITSAGSLAGSVTIEGGAIYAGNNCFDSVSSITITNNATLDVAGGNIPNLTPVTVSGTGLNGEGAIYNSYSNYPSESLKITLAGDTKFGGSARWDLATGSHIAGPYNLTLDWSAGAGYSQWNSVVIGATLAGVFVTNGSSLGMNNNDSSCQNPATTINVGSGCTMAFYNGGFDGSIHVMSSGTVDIYSAPAPFTGESLTLEDSAAWISYYNTGANTPVNYAVTLNGVAHFVIGDHFMIYSNVISGPGGFVLDYYNNEMVMSASNTYSGPTIVGSSGNTPEVALAGNGSISHSSLIFFGGNSPTTGHLDVSGRNDQTLTLASGQTLAGIGAINGSLVVSAGATISPAGTNTTIGITTGSNPVGGLTASDNIELGGTTIIKLDGSANNDTIGAEGTITYGGTLNLVNISGAPLAAGNSFQVFEAGAITGLFASITPATPGPGLAWDLSQLSSGIIGVLASGAPIIGSTRISGGNLIFSGSGGTANGTYVVLSATNATTVLRNWTPIATNNYDASGNFSVTNALVPGVPQRFYTIEQ